MKKYLLIILCSVFAANSQAQLNTSFEEWEEVTDYEDPSGWFTFNFFSQFGSNVSCFKSTSSHWGDYSLGLSPVIFPGIDSIPGTIARQDAIDYRPKSISLYYFYPTKGKDTSNFTLTLFKGTMDPSNIIGMANISLASNTVWQKVSADIEWMSNEIPDSFVMGIVTSETNLRDTIWIDDIESSEFSTGVDQIAKQDEMTVFVNKEKCLELKLNNQDLSEEAPEVTIFNSEGKVVFKGTYRTPIDLQNYASGVFFIETVLNNKLFREKLLFL